MLTYPIAVTAFIAGSTTAAVPRSTKQEFINTMRKFNVDPKIMAEVAKSSRSLTKRIKEEAIMVPPGRELEYSSNSNQRSSNNYNYGHAVDDFLAYNYDVDWDNQWGFDASQYSLSYERCATVKHFDVDKAAAEDSTSPFRTQHFAVLRLCPSATCDNRNWNAGSDDATDDQDQAYAVQAAYTAGYQAATQGTTQGATQAEETVYGANGSGCSSNYATFLLDAGKYLSLMADYQDTQFEMYCGYCKNYMMKQYNKWVQKGGRQLTFEEFQNDSEVHRSLGGEQNACKVYYKACNSGAEDDYADYLSCTQVEKNNGAVAYTAATCSSDGQTMTIGLYSDEYCSEDISSSTSIRNWIGENVDDESMAHYYKKFNSGLATLIESYGGKSSINPDAMCIPCASQEDDFFATDDDDKFMQGEIADICDAVFLQSVRCDKTLANWKQHAKNSIYAESIALEDVSCGYIDAMRMGKYDVEGNVVLDLDQATGLNGNIYYAEYVNDTTPLQIFFLVLSISACVMLSAWSANLHKSINKGGLKWKPRQGKGAHEEEVSRNDSGIVLGRSQSNHTSYYMS